MTKHISLIILTILAIGSFNLQAQESTNTSGGQTNGDHGTVTYSLGQVVYTQQEGSTGSVNQGVQQSYEISVVAGIENTNIDLSISVYPNPTLDYLTLKIEDFKRGNFRYQLLNVQGKILAQDELLQPIYRINMDSYQPNIYFCLIKTQNQIIKTFKIIKN
ncbi:T9SS type A sorting domain-containing protein [Reichenbachiella sp.]|uniref:T9SS type A sorting domain-containing protein n=1 Tax=Reichenbachiella sp. TaxID=2184521 RepID=UPI003BB1682B